MHHKLIKEYKIQKLHSNKSTKLGKGIEVWRIELVCCFSALSTWLELILCINIHCSGSLTYSKWQSKTRYLLNNYNNVYATLTHISPTLYMKISADHCSKNINCYSHLCYQLKFSSAKTKLNHNNGDTS